MPLKNKIAMIDELIHQASGSSELETKAPDIK